MDGRTTFRLVTAAGAGVLTATAVAAQMPYQATEFASAAGCPKRQCVLLFPKVPAGQRLMVTAVSAQVDPSIDAIVLEGTSATYFVPTLNPRGSYVSAPVTLYYGPNTTPTARIFAGGTGNTSLLVTLVGNLVPE